MPTETRTFVGDTHGHAFDGMAGFRIGQQYQLTYTKEFDEVRIVLNHHEHVSRPHCACKGKHEALAS